MKTQTYRSACSLRYCLLASVICTVIIRTVYVPPVFAGIMPPSIPIPAVVSPDVVGAEFLVNTETNNAQSNPSVAMDMNGNFVIAWQSNVQDGGSFGVYAQRYSADGTQAGGEFRVNTETRNSSTNSSAAMDADGNFVVSWHSSGQDARW